MEQQQEKIRRFSKIVHILLNVTFVLGIVSIIIAALSLLLKTPYIFKLGNTQVVVPDFVLFLDKINTVWGAAQDSGSSALANLAQEIVLVIVLGFTRAVFRLLRDNGTPFRTDVAKALKNLAIALIVFGVFSGLAGWISAAIVGVLYMIFNYGCALQQESDTTL
jgi:hypothetical protein